MTLIPVSLLGSLGTLPRHHSFLKFAHALMAWGSAVLFFRKGLSHVRQQHKEPIKKPF